MKEKKKLNRTVPQPWGVKVLLPTINALPDKKKFIENATHEKAVAYSNENPEWFSKMKTLPEGQKTVEGMIDKWKEEAEEILCAEVAQIPQVKDFFYPNNALGALLQRESPKQLERSHIDLLYSIRKALLHIAENGKATFVPVNAYLIAKPKKAGRRTIQALCLAPDQIYNNLIGVDSERFGICPICGNIFWKGRLSRPACSGNCRNTLRVRKWRENQAKYEEKRAMTPPKDSKLRKGGK